jgi:DNA-binding NarL/FixJ family response regulator
LDQPQQGFGARVPASLGKASPAIVFDASLQPPASAAPAGGLRIGLIDHYRFSQECVIGALARLQPDDVVVPYSDVRDCIADGDQDLDLILFYSHDIGIFEAGALQTVGAIRRAFPMVRLIVLADAEDAQDPAVARRMLECGAHGFIPTRTTGIYSAVAALRKVNEGGIYIPPEQHRIGVPQTQLPQHRRLTAREISVLAHLKRGNANKIIAYELGMSENTVKIHVRNIIRKMDATNRTQAVYKARSLLHANA